MKRLIRWLRTFTHPDEVYEDEAGEMQHAEERWVQEQTDQVEMNEVREDIREADTVRVFLENSKAELEARLSGIQRLSDIRHPRPRRSGE